MRSLNVCLAAAALLYPLAAQTPSGTLTTADTGAPVPGASVVAIQKSPSPGQKPTILQSLTDSDGNYTINAPPGQYTLCVHPVVRSLYLDPCQWGSPPIAVVGTPAPVPVPIKLQKGARFIVRVHDPNGLLAQAETVKGAAISAALSGGPLTRFPLPLIYEDNLIRDYGTVVLISVPLNVTVSSGTLSLTDSTGAALSSAPIPFQILPTDAEVTGAQASPALSMFPPPDARIVDVYAAALKSALGAVQ
jgi:hypothetical protein